MTNILITGMSGTGKSSIINELKKLGFRTIDMDYDNWSEMRNDGEWVWSEEKIKHELVNNKDDVLFVAGCAINQGEFYPFFDSIILLSAPTNIILQRLKTRDTNKYGKKPREIEDVLHNIKETEPLLRKSATHEIDTSIPLSDVLNYLLKIIKKEK